MTISLAEGSRLDGVELPRAVALALTELNVATVSLTTIPGAYNLSNIRKVGTFAAGGEVVRITPKTTVQRLFALLGYARDPGAVWRDEDIPFEQDNDLYSSVAHAFARAMEVVLRRGAMRGYVSKDESLPLVRGRWQVTDQITRRAGQLLPLEVVYDDYVDDILENQLVKSAALRLLRFVALPGDVRTALYRGIRLLEGVSVVPPGSKPPPISFTRVNAHYRNVIALARLILSDSSLEHREGTVIGSGFLVDLWAVFEDFVGVSMIESFSSHGGSAITQFKSRLDRESRIRIEPDIVWEVDGQVRAVIDLKYKIEHNGSYPNADLYQLIAYCARFGLGVGHLVYASGQSEAQRIDVVNGPTIFQHALDLDVPFDSLRDQIGTLVHDIVQMSESF